MNQEFSILCADLVQSARNLVIEKTGHTRLVNPCYRQKDQIDQIWVVSLSILMSLFVNINNISKTRFGKVGVKSSKWITDLLLKPDATQLAKFDKPFRDCKFWKAGLPVCKRSWILSCRSFCLEVAQSHRYFTKILFQELVKTYSGIYCLSIV